MPQGADDADEGEDDELQAFRRAMQDVRPLKASQRITAPRPRGQGRARFARAERAAVLRESLESTGSDLYELQPGDELLFRRTGVPETVLRRLRRGLYRVESEVDLHGLTVAEAMLRLGSYLRDSEARKLRCVQVIHGKGLRSGTRGPVLKNLVNTLLRQTEAVLAFASARPVAGGTGATLVLLRSG